MNGYVRLVCFVEANSFSLPVFIESTITSEEFVEGAVGTNVTFPCHTGQDSNIVVWHHYPIGAKFAKIIYWEDEVFEAYRDRFRVISSRIGEFNLMILGVNLTDAAKYTCTSGQLIRSFELTVLGKYNFIT